MRRNILVVEDNKDLRIFIMKSITSLGDYTPIGASNGKDAIEKLSEYKVDLVITDIRMPEMDGIEFIAYLNNKYPHIPVIVLTAYPEYEEEISKYQTMKYLLKPVDKEKLKKAIDAKLIFDRDIANKLDPTIPPKEVELFIARSEYYK